MDTGPVETPREVEPTLARHLCYACHTNFISRASRSPEVSLAGAPLPAWTSAALQDSVGHFDDEFMGRKLTALEMKSELREFLLED